MASRSARRQCFALVAVLAVAGAGCAASSSTSPSFVRHVSYTYSCCVAADIETVRHPGDVVTLHWIVAPSSESAQAQPDEPVTLAASLNGPFSDVASLKSAPNGASALPAAAVKTTTWAGGAPISRIQIPSITLAGYYNLSFRVGSGGSSDGGASVIQVVAP